MAVKAVVFDIGGVLADDVWEHLLLDDDGVRAKFPNLARGELERIGKVLWEAFAYVSEGPNTWQELERRYWKIFIQYFNKQLPVDVCPDHFIEMTDKFIRPIEGVEQILKQLQSQKVKLAICSGNNEFWFRRQMQKLGYHRFFSPNRIILSCRIGFSKSSPGLEMFRATADALRLPEVQCVLVDDRESSVERARQYGMIGILFSGASDLEARLKELGL